jgi:hypothetical protein
MDLSVDVEMIALDKPGEISVEAVCFTEIDEIVL